MDRAFASSGKCVDIASAGTANGVKVQQWACNNTAAQQFDISAISNGIYRLSNANSSKVWDVSDRKTTPGTLLVQWVENGGQHQQFVFKKQADGYQIKAVHSGLCVEANGTTDGTQLVQNNCHGQASQRFLLTHTASPASKPGPNGRIGNTLCVNSDGPNGKDAYTLLRNQLGNDTVEAPDNAHNPPIPHIKEASDNQVGTHFVFLAHEPIDGDRDNNQADRSRIEVKVGPGSADWLKAKNGSTFTYTWRFKIDPAMKFSNRFTHLHQIKAKGGSDGTPIITLTGRAGNPNDWLELQHVDDADKTTKIKRVSMIGIKGIWLDVTEQITYGERGSYAVTVKKPDGSTIMQTGKLSLPMWRTGAEYVRPKWGIYRGHSDMLNQTEDQVRFANFGITAGNKPDSNCR
ncbi:RICIN domain-containing protein [Chitinivorax sp. B]|uniref:RICIN domain-containing protein n=1 Tax=Chitinivorax sp. B TaxID=2502235 RepID=UPI001485ACCA|nr:RICIN domain-containing protein [Chitinivorax sp. B]